MKFIYLFIISILILSCVETTSKSIEYTTSCKVIKAKDAPIENKFSSGDYFFGEGSVTKSQTVYYFYFKDGSSKEVKRETYFKFDEGEKYCVKTRS